MFGCRCGGLHKVDSHRGMHEPAHSYRDSITARVLCGGCVAPARWAVWMVARPLGKEALSCAQRYKL
eukprot:366099-Chlamydomonas_euryale.AAC.8